MITIKQIIAVTALNLRNIPQRLASSVVAVVGVGAVVLVFAAVLSMAAGLERTMLSAGSDDTAIILRNGSTSELNSGLSNEQVLIVSNAPGVLKDGNSPIVSAELYVVVDVKKRSNQSDANVPFRGVQASAFDVRRNVTITDGRMFEEGRNEIIVGRSAQQEFMGLETGKTIRFGQTEWVVVGTFDADGSVSESELWTDVRILQNAYRRGNSFQSVRVKLESPGSIETLQQALADDPRIDPDVLTERGYYSSQSQGLVQFIKLIGYPLRALGFGPTAVLVSTVVESVLLALVGGALGGLFAFLVFNGFQVSTLNGPSFSQVVFDFAVTPELLAQGMRAALLIGVVGGLFPAIRAARLPVATALREL